SDPASEVDEPERGGDEARPGVPARTKTPLANIANDTLCFIQSVRITGLLFQNSRLLAVFPFPRGIMTTRSSFAPQGTLPLGDAADFKKPQQSASSSNEGYVVLNLYASAKPRSTKGNAVAASALSVGLRRWLSIFGSPQMP